MTAFRRIAFGLISLVLLPAEALAQRPIDALAKEFDPERPPVLRERIFRVPAENESRAFQLLGNEEFVIVGPDDLEKLFPGVEFDTNDMLERQAKVARDYARERERNSKDPFFESHWDWMKETAIAHNKFADYTRKTGKGACALPYQRCGVLRRDGRFFGAVGW